ncbi:MAG: 50S ribosomal protein L11 methyltransferase [Leptospiraceae bacterium]|nr:50S ribosomal protein L11 methyltransferase [Leptospiraceae bacterium]
MKYQEVKVNLPKEIAEEFTEFLDSLQVEGYYEILFDSTIPKKEEEGIIRDNTHIHIYLPENDINKEIQILIFLKTNCNENYFLESRVVETKEFALAYQEFYKPFTIGESFSIIPIWEKDSEKAQEISKDKIPLYINPGMAFGTGHHETTKLMLTRMQNVVQSKDSVIDLGTGSGILSIGAALLGAEFILAIDIDPNAVKACEYNWSENNFPSTKTIKILEGGFDHEEIFQHEFQVLLANITFAVISQNISRIKKIKTNRFLFSGIITEKKEDSMELFTKELGGKLVSLEEFNGWLMIDWKR